MKKPIPDEFTDKAEENQKKECIVCHINLTSSENTYLLEKAVRNFPDLKARETIFEYAICTQCATKAQQKLSRESREKVEELFKSEDVQKNSFQIAMDAMQNGEAPHYYCLITGKKMEDCSEYQIYAYCKGEYLMENMQTFMLSGEALEIIQELLSPETRDELEDFRNKNFGLPPELEKLINSRDMIFF